MNSIKSKGNRYIKHMTSWLFYCVLLLFMLLALVAFTVPVPSSTLTSRWWLKIDCSGSVYTAEISKRYQARPLFVCLWIWQLNMNQDTLHVRICVSTHAFSSPGLIIATLEMHIKELVKYGLCSCPLWSLPLSSGTPIPGEQSPVYFVHRCI